jgi:nucleoside-diphosphate kinase
MAKDNKKTFKKFCERTLVLIKPDGVQRQLCGRIIQRFEDAGLKIVGVKMVWADKDFAEKHYIAHQDKKFFKPLVDFLIEGPVIALALEGLHAVEIVRKIIGGTEPRTATPGTIRGDFACHSYEYMDAQNKTIRNLIHASGAKDEAKKELSQWFSVDELHSYSTVHEKHVC